MFASMENTPQAPSQAPPAYSTSDQFNPTEKSDVILPQQSEPGLAAASALSRGLQVPSRSTACTSGFEYPDELAHCGVSTDQWAQFTHLICQEAKLSRQQWTTVIGKGLGTLGVGGLMIGILGAIPAAFVLRLSKQRQEQRNLIAAMAGVEGDHLARHISHWNETFFQPRGILIRVDLPDEYLKDLEEMEISKKGTSSKSTRKDRVKASQKARIVIIPLKESMSG